MKDMPKTFDEALKIRQKELVASNLTNLASAHVGLEEEKIRLKSKIRKVEDLQNEIRAMGNRDAEDLGVDEIKELYNRATRLTRD